MRSVNSPSGAYFPYYYKGGELFGLHLGSYYSDEEAVIAMIRKEQDFLVERNHNVPIWIDLCHTKLTAKVTAELVAYLKAVRHRITKLALVGCSFRDNWRIVRLVKKTEGLSSLPVRCFDDPEDAKTWLVSEY